MTERSIPTSVMAELERAESPDALIWFMVVEHASLADPIRVVSDVFDYVLDGATYKGMPFDARALTDSDEMPTAQLRMQNVDRRIGQALENAKGRARVESWVYSTADFDLSQDPRVATGTPATIYSFQQFWLTNVEVNVLEITGRLSLVDYSQEPWPWIRATSDRFPGLFV